MDSQLLHDILEMIECEVRARPREVDFELAYQARIAIEKIRFVIKHTEVYCPHSAPMRDAGLQLLDALERLESADRKFQERSRNISRSQRTTNGHWQKFSSPRNDGARAGSDSEHEKTEY